MKRLFYILIGSILLSFPLSAQESQGSWVKPDDAVVIENLSKWQDSKFGLMMHWGPYSQRGVVESWSICAEDEPFCFQGENYVKYKQDYERLPFTFNPVDFDPAKWARAAKDAGMRYVVFTTKHHDGFCMFDTKTTDYKITSTNCLFHDSPKKDVTLEIFNAFRNEGMMTGAYFSKPDWNSEYFWWPKFSTPDRNANYSITKYPERWQKFVDFTHTQIDELCSNYGKLDILWFDGGWVNSLKPEELIFSVTMDGIFRQHGYTQLRVPQNQDLKMDQIVANARRKQPGIIVVDRFADGPNQNYMTPEQVIPSTYLPYPWETCLTMGGSWSFNPKENYKSARQLIHTLVDVVSKGGNLLLNIGPGPDGKWHQEAYDRLKEIAGWMNLNHDAIYNTRGTEKFADRNIRFTQGKSGKVFATYLVAEDEKIMPDVIVISSFLPQEGSAVNLLGYKRPLSWKRIGNSFSITIPGELRNNPPCRYAWVFSISPKPISC